MKKGAAIIASLLLTASVYSQSSSTSGSSGTSGSGSSTSSGSTIQTPQFIGFSRDQQVWLKLRQQLDWFVQRRQSGFDWLEHNWQRLQQCGYVRQLRWVRKHEQLW